MQAHLIFSTRPKYCRRLDAIALALAVGDDLYATTMSGAIQRLSGDGKEWQYVGQLAHPRFFHRLLPLKAGSLLVVGGASMAVGKICEVELLKIESGR